MSRQSPHILQDFEQAINTLRSEVVAMAGKTRHNLERAVRSLLERNAELANAVIVEDDEIDEAERIIDRMGMGILVRFHPMAGDLRMVVSSMKISMNLERISDHARSIAKRARKVSASQELQESLLIEPIYTLADELLRDAITSYTEADVNLGAELHGRDKELDRAHKKATAIFGDRIESADGRSQDYLHLIFIVRSLERIGDLAVNIGEDAVFAEAAKDLRHKSGEGREAL